MRTFRHEKGDVIHVDGVVADHYASRQDWTEIDTGVAAAATGEAPLEGFTVPQLKEYAASSGVDLGGASTKGDIITKIEEN